MTIACILSIISAGFIAVSDIRHRIIPDVWLWPMLLSGLYVCGGASERITAAIAGYVLGFALMALFWKKDGLGYGDVKLLAVLGLWLGVNGLSVAVVLACVLGVVWGLIRKCKYVPFAPFLFIGAAAWHLIVIGCKL